jgi:hypothetical protein
MGFLKTNSHSKSVCFDAALVDGHFDMMIWINADIIGLYP